MVDRFLRGGEGGQERRSPHRLGRRGRAKVWWESPVSHKPEGWKRKEPKAFPVTPAPPRGNPWTGSVGMVFDWAVARGTRYAHSRALRAGPVFMLAGAFRGFGWRAGPACAA